MTASQKVHLRRCVSSFVIAAYFSVRLIPQDSRALHLELVPSTLATSYEVVLLVKAVPLGARPPHFPLGDNIDGLITGCRISVKVDVGTAGRWRQAGRSAAQSASGASTFLRSEKKPPGFPPHPRPKAGPRSPLSMLRLCAFAKQTSLPRTTCGDRLAVSLRNHGDSPAVS